jgi:hypothetical protein
LDISSPIIPTEQPLDVDADVYERDVLEPLKFMSDDSSDSESSFMAPDYGNISHLKVRPNTSPQASPVEPPTARRALPRKKTTNYAGVQTEIAVPKDGELYGKSLSTNISSLIQIAHTS